MSVLIRMIERNKWKQYIDLYTTDNKIASFPVTNDLATCKNNTLSVWEAELDDEQSFELTLLTMAASRPHLQDLDISIIEKDKLLSEGVQLKNSSGVTKLDDFSEKHWDLVNLDIENLKTVSTEILCFLRESTNNEHTKKIRYNANALIKLFIKYHELELIDIECLEESFKLKIHRKMDSIS